MIEAILILLVLVLIVLITPMLRMLIVHRNYMRAMNLSDRLGPPFNTIWHSENDPVQVYDRLYKDMTKWTFNQMFPEFKNDKH
jgi:hypothetical protein